MVGAIKKFVGDSVLECEQDMKTALDAMEVWSWACVVVVVIALCLPSWCS